jgi:hypothetical protein
MNRSKLRPLGQITTQMEPLLQELVIQHQLQKHEIIGLVSSYLQAHLPGCNEEYEDGTSSVVYVGHIEGLK